MHEGGLEPKRHIPIEFPIEHRSIVKTTSID